METESDPRRRLDLLAGRIEDAIATIWRQIAMNRYEEDVHTSRRRDGELSPDGLSEKWLSCQRDLFGDSVDTDGYDAWWSYIPHFASVPGYVYAYAYGYLFSLAIYRRYEVEGDAMVEPYFDLLRKGGSESPEQLAEIVGLDLADPAIWAGGIEALDELLGEAEALADEAL
jgi:oligoendopeptidase F